MLHPRRAAVQSGGCGWLIGGEGEVGQTAGSAGSATDCGPSVCGESTQIVVSKGDAQRGG